MNFNGLKDFCLMFVGDLRNLLVVTRSWYNSTHVLVAIKRSLRQLSRIHQLHSGAWSSPKSTTLLLTCLRRTTAGVWTGPGVSAHLLERRRSFLSRTSSPRSISINPGQCLVELPEIYRCQSWVRTTQLFLNVTYRELTKKDAVTKFLDHIRICGVQ